jgi:hypothetical protein
VKENDNLFLHYIHPTMMSKERSYTARTSKVIGLQVQPAAARSPNHGSLFEIKLMTMVLNVQTRKNESSIACKRSSQKDTLKPKALLMGLSNEATCSKKKTCTYFTCLVFVLLSRADSNNVLSY